MERKGRLRRLRHRMDLAVARPRRPDDHRGQLHPLLYRKRRSLIRLAETEVRDGSLCVATVLWLGMEPKPMPRLVSGMMLSH
jgi:hypothetical protein